MQIPGYRIQNVLSVYSQKLGDSRRGSSRKAAAPAHPASRVQLSVEGKRQEVVNKVAANIVARISRFGPQDDTDHEILEQLNREITNEESSAADPSQEAFVYNAVDGENRKHTHHMDVGKSEFFLKRLEELARKAVDRNMAKPAATKVPREE